MKGIIFTKHNYKKRGHEVLILIKKHKMLTLLLCFLLAGMIFGTVSSRFAKESSIESLDFLFASNFKSRISQPAIQTFIASLTSSFVFIMVLFLISLSLWGFLVIPAIPFFRGLGLGITAGYLYSYYGLKGVLFHLLVLFPGVFISSIAIILFAKESIYLSSKLISKMLPNESSEKIWPKFQLYIRRMIYVLIIIFVSSIVDTLLSLIFAGRFSF